MQDYNTYEKDEPLKLDLRRYAKYVKERNIKREDTTLDILAFFSKQKE